PNRPATRPSRPVRSAVHIVGISGSLKPGSTNSELLQALADRAGGGIEIWTRLADLPHFVPGDDGGEPVASLRDAITRAHGVLLATPEYAGGMPGTLKNALDWLVGTGELYGGRVAVISAAPSAERGTNARHWVETVVTMQGAEVVASFSVAPDDE